MVTLLVVALALGLNNFAASVGLGVGGTVQRVRVAVVFGLFEIAMPVIGLLLGRGLASAAPRLAWITSRWVSHSARSRFPS